jgi:hypothetical protein
MACKNENTPIKLDFPAPLAPMTTLMAPSRNASTEAMLLKPLIVMKSNSGDAMGRIMAKMLKNVDFSL